MDFELGRIGVRPIGEIYDHPNLAHARRRNLQEVGRGFHDAEPIGIEEVGVIAVHLIELRYQGMTLRRSFLSPCADMSGLAAPGGVDFTKWWVERSETHRHSRRGTMGFASGQPILHPLSVTLYLGEHSE